MSIYACYQIFVLGKYEEMWGKSISLSVSLGLTGLGAIIIMVGFGIGVALFKTKITTLYTLLSSIVFSTMILVVGFVAERYLHTTDLRQVALFIFTLLGSFLFAGILRIVVGQEVDKEKCKTG
ncbi:hypothetical protein UWK_02725 [Desulfocapsa sulfexigens DSM 10523]|uniref:Uncharacterized protein n=1 Tax=Desulfocapsa sulfexigens (strain DSM 10523 / SB164P1) TaxID=1167006 RepID=M1PSD0_DESSD|nr:hypothetical protein [Desulfocapsa sulfexigens]AGF79261.1 hypothetical protein UWK_02725 [Desulfocapsa sulfexigens DSM 10523]